MKIIFVTSALHGGGAERVLVTLANWCVRAGDDVILLMVAGEEHVYQLDNAVKMISIGQPSFGNPWIQIKRLYRMRRFFLAHKDSRIVSFSTTINLFTIIASVGLTNRVIISERNDPERCSYKALRNLIYGLGKGFVFQTEMAQKCFPAYIRKRSIVIPNPIRRQLPHNFDGMREKKIAAVGRLEPQKNHRLLLEAFAGFQKSFPAYELHIFGTGKLEQELKNVVKEKNLDDCVIFEGFKKDVLEIIRSYEMFVLSSDYEGISNSLMEAMALGISCIATDCPAGGSALCIQHGINGLLVPVGNVAELQAAMEELASDMELLSRIGKRAVQIRDTFAEECIVSTWRDFINGAVC